MNAVAGEADHAGYRKPPIPGRDLLLREAVWSDLPALARFVIDAPPQYLDFIGWARKARERADCHADLSIRLAVAERSLVDYLFRRIVGPEAFGLTNWVIARPPLDDVLGCIQLTITDRPEVGEIGYFVIDTQTRRHVARTAMLPLLTEAFERRNLLSVELAIDPANGPSLAMAESCVDMLAFEDLGDMDRMQMTMVPPGIQHARVFALTVERWRALQRGAVTANRARDRRIDLASTRSDASTDSVCAAATLRRKVALRCVEDVLDRQNIFRFSSLDRHSPSALFDDMFVMRYGRQPWAAAYAIGSADYWFMRRFEASFQAAKSAVMKGSPDCQAIVDGLDEVVLDKVDSMLQVVRIWPTVVRDAARRANVSPPPTFANLQWTLFECADDVLAVADRLRMPRPLSSDALTGRYVNGTLSVQWNRDTVEASGERPHDMIDSLPLPGLEKADLQAVATVSGLMHRIRGREPAQFADPSGPTVRRHHDVTMSTSLALLFVVSSLATHAWCHDPVALEMTAGRLSYPSSSETMVQQIARDDHERFDEELAVRASLDRVVARA
jgi:RimJ/RimL family protein N-acetyltransferase